MKHDDKPLGKKIGVLPKKEKKLLISQLNTSLRKYKVGMIFAVLSIVFLVGILIAPSIYYVIIKINKKLRKLHIEEIDIYEMTGILSVSHVGRSSYIEGRMPIVTCWIDGILVPGEIILVNSDNGIKGFVGAKVRFQYLPQVSMNRQFCNKDGQGYNFITKSILTSY
jgi:hypothetical protein